MNKILLTTALVLIAGLIVWKLTRKKRGVVYLGAELAEATKKEKQRVAEGGHDKSPLPNYDYSRWPDENSFLNPKENSLDSSIRELSYSFKSSSVEEQSRIRKSISQDNIYILLEYTRRNVLFALNKKKSSYIKDGLLSIALIESERCDYRDVYTALGLLGYGAQHLNIDINDLKEILPLCENRTREIFEAFAQRMVAGKIDPGEFSGYVPIETSEGVGFVSTYLEAYNPKLSLTKILFEMVEHFKKDAYTGSNLTVGSKISSYWLDAEKNKKIEDILKKQTGCASIHAYSKSDVEKKRIIQMLLVYLAEYNSEEDIKLLLQQASGKPKSFARLCFAEGNILCLVVERATMAGIEDAETSESLKRFELPLRSIIKSYY